MSILISKLGVQYETVYYYKQKVVNWDFVAPNKYVCIFDTVGLDQERSVGMTNLSISNPFKYVGIDVFAYITEESYKNNSILYDVYVSNVTSPKVPVTLMDCHNTNKDTVSEIKYLSRELIDSTPYLIEKLNVRYLGAIYPLNDHVKIHISTKFPNGVYEQSASVLGSVINFFNDVKKVVADNNVTSTTNTSLRISKNLLSIPQKIENFSSVIPVITTNRTYSHISGSRLPIKTVVCSAVEDVCSTNISLLLEYSTSKTNLSFSTSTTIVH